jgi:integrase
VDFERNELRVESKKPGLVKVKNQDVPIFAWEAKDHERRTIPVHPNVLKSLAPLRLKSGGCPYVFLTIERLLAVARLRQKREDNASMNPRVHFLNNLRTRFQAIQRRAHRILTGPNLFGASSVQEWVLGTPHDMRKTYITRAARAGVPMHVLQKLAGHESIETTARYYLGISQADADQVRKSASGGSA